MIKPLRRPIFAINEDADMVVIIIAKNCNDKGNVTIAMNNVNVEGDTVGFNTFDKTTGSWFWKKQYRYIKDSNNLSASALIYNVIP